MADEKLRSIIEALLFVTDRPLSLKDLKEIVADLGDFNVGDLMGVIEALRKEYADAGRSFLMLTRVSMGGRS